MRAASVLIPAHNEEQNISALVQRVAGESDARFMIDDIVVVASGCSDATVDRAQECIDRGLPVRVLVQQRREGKASAINLGLSVTRHDNVVLVSGDVLPAEGAIRMLLEALDDRSVGAAGGRPVPLNEPSTFVGFAAQMMWSLHDTVSSRALDPKLGEMIAFRRRLDGRNVVTAIPHETAVDEVAIQAICSRTGLSSRYIADARVSTWGPSNLRDWFKQRRRINAGHMLSAREGYRPQTMNAWTVLGAATQDPLCRQKPAWVVAVASIELLAKAAAAMDLFRHRTHTVWDVAETTKKAIEQEA